MSSVIARRARGVVLGLALICAAGAALASEALPLGAFLSLVERHNPELEAARQQRMAADGEVLAARAYPNPELEFSTGPWRSRAGGASGSAQAYAFSQPIDLPSVRTPRIGAASSGVEAAEARLAAARVEIGAQARSAFNELLRRQQEERIARENAVLIDQIRDRVQRRFEVGDAPRFELVRAEAEALAAQNGIAAAALRVEEGRAALRRLAANQLPIRFEVQGGERIPDSAPPLSVLQPDMLSRHPSLRGLAAEEDRARRRLELEQALRAPQPALRAGESRDPEMRSSVLGLTLSVPLWNRREGQIAQARAAIGVAAAQREQQRVQLLRELDTAHAQFAIAQRQIQTFEAGLLRSAQAALQAAETAYRLGERGFFEVIDAQRTLRVVRADYTRAQFDRAAAWLEIERLLARDPFRLEIR